jgi:RecA/RadA recombinase
MTITFVGNEIPDTERIITGFHSLDKALGNQLKGTLGFPIKTMVEIYGPSGIGKTTYMLSFGGLLAAELGGKIAFADFEGQSKDTVTNSLEMNGFSGELDMLRNSKTTSHYQILDNMIEEFRTPECNVALVDSIGAFMPPGEEEGSVVDANMGQRPRIIGNWTRKMIDILAKPNKRATCMYVSHQHSNIGFIGKHTSGGETKAFLNAIQIELKKKDNYETGWLLEGKISKARHGQVGNYFHVFCVGGQGIHKGLSAVFDCVSAGLATIDRNVVRLDGYDSSFGKVARMIETHKDESQFAPFINALMAKEVENNEEINQESLDAMIANFPTKKTRKKK